jgi:HEPN domain-containing protein
MSVIKLLLTKSLYKRLHEIATSSGVDVEELVVETLARALNVPLDPQDMMEFHLKFSEKYLVEAEELLKRGDYVQASEKGWGAAAQVVKAIAAKEGRRVLSHDELHREVVRIAKAVNDDEIRRLWQSAIALHQNFYENWLPQEMVERNIEDIKKLIEKLKRLL